MERLIIQFGKDKNLGLLAGRELIGADWFRWLKKNIFILLYELKKI